MPRDSFFLRFYHGIVPSCLGETMVLALEDRADSFSIGRDLNLDRVREIGRLAEAHGFVFSEALACGQSLTSEARSQFLKVLSSTRPARSRPPCRCDDRAAVERAGAGLIDLANLAGHAAERHGRHINPVLIGVGGPSGMARTFVRGEGAELFDESGRAYLDFVAGFGSLNLGHNHPLVAAAVTSALVQLPPGFSPGSVNPLAAALAEQLVAVTPPGLEIVFFTNSGAESIEAALEAGAGRDRPRRLAVVPGLVSRQDSSGPSRSPATARIRAPSGRWSRTARRSPMATRKPSRWHWPPAGTPRSSSSPSREKGEWSPHRRDTWPRPDGSAERRAHSSSSMRCRPGWGGRGRCSPSSAKASRPIS